jgi:hypothetical protein
MERYVSTKLAEGISQEQAEAQWEKLDIILKATLINIQHQEEQNMEDLRLGLLATLSEYRGYPHIKQLFEEAIRSVSASACQTN